MFDQTFIETGPNSKKRFTMLLSLLLQIMALAALIAAPLIYTQVLPNPQLRSVFAAPTPPPPAVPKPPMTVRTAVSSPRLFRFNALSSIVPLPRSMPPEVAAPPAISDGAPGGDPSSTGVPLIVGLIKPPDPLPATGVKRPAAKPLRIASMETSQLIHQVQPTYPPMAKQVRVQGVVEFTAVIGKTGNIENLQLVRGHPMLVKAAEEAILQWKYKPTLLNGEPVEVITDIVVNFTLTP
jgi:periplasmic protein TonB